jgi:hypothetical protein
MKGLHMTESFPNISSWQSIKVVSAGEITEVVPAGCYVKTARDGETVLLTYPDEKMTARYGPQIGDFWVIYPDGYQAISPREPFITGYVSKES